MIELTARCALLDIEGTVSDIRFVYDVMFPYARQEVPGYLRAHWETAEVQSAITTVAADAGHASPEAWLGVAWRDGDTNTIDAAIEHLLGLMAQDSKATGLKNLQGQVWKFGFESGAIRAELFDDVLPALKRWRANGIDIKIYSSGSVLAQQMFFRHTTLGNLGDLFSSHFDTTIGIKRESSSYQRIALECAYAPSEIIFFTDVFAEITAAQSAGMQTVACIRPNNAPLPLNFTGLTATSFADVELIAPR